MTRKKFIIGTTLVILIILSGIAIYQLTENNNNTSVKEETKEEIEKPDYDEFVMDELQENEKKFENGIINENEYLDRKRELEDSLLEPKEYVNAIAKRYIEENPNATEEEIEEVRKEASLKKYLIDDNIDKFYSR